jgi:hypothetical protein
MDETAVGAGLPIPAEVIERLTKAAARLATVGQDMSPAEAAAVATTRADALRLLFGRSEVPGSEQVFVYVVMMTGRFTAQHSPPGVRRPEGSVLTVILDAGTLRTLDLTISNQDNRALLPRLGPVSPLAIQ